MNAQVPEGWGKDPLSRFIEDAYHNCIASFVNYRDLPVMTAVKEVDASFRSMLCISFHPKEEILLPSFAGRSQAAYLSSIQLSMAGQVPEAYVAIRLCLENALYALFIQDDPMINEEIPQRWKIWLDRGTDEEATKKCRTTFTHANVRDCLITRDGPLGKRASSLYERTITYGAHPNVYALVMASELADERGGSVHYLMPNTLPAKVCIQTAVDVGICTLRVFHLILNQRFEDAGILARIDWLNWPS